MTNILKITGRVVSGLGEGARYVRLYSSVFKEYLGITPYPGTLNISVDRDYSRELLKIRHIVIPPPYEGLGYVLAYKGVLKDLDIYVIKPLRSRYGWNVLEIISEYCLREKLGLKDNDYVEVVIMV